MRKPIIIILFFQLALNFLGAADLIRPGVELTPISGGVQVQLDFEGITPLQWQQMLEDPESFHEYGYGVAGAPGDAALPMLTEMIPIKTSGPVSLGGVEHETLPLEAISLKSALAGHLDSDPQPEQVSAYDWSQSVRSAEEVITLGDPIYMLGKQFLPVTIRPVTMDQGDQSLEVPTSIQFDISGIELSDNFTRQVEHGGRSVSDPDDQFPRKGHYLIITPSNFEPYLEGFTQWKQRMGFEVTVVNTQTAGYSASTISTYIQQAWDNWDSRPTDLLIIGDEDVNQGIPGHYINNPWGVSLVTDHPYALMEGDDSFPELMVGRLSVDTIYELLAFTAKIVAYESTPYMTNTDWFKRAVMISTDLGAISARKTKDWVEDKLIENGYTEVLTAHHPAVSTAHQVASRINSGVGFVNYRGFGMHNGWWGPEFTNNDVNTLIGTGSKTPVITSVVCGGGNFAAPEDPCFGEAWTRIGTSSIPNGAVAFFGPSELYTHTQYNNVIDIGVYSGIFDLGLTTLGEALWNGKYELWRNYHSNTYFPFDQTPEFYHSVYNLLGDPGMQLWTDIPEILTVSHPDTLSTGENSIAFYIGDAGGAAISGAYVSVLNTENAIGGYTDNSGQINLPLEISQAGTIQLTVSGNNLHPYLASIPIVEQEHRLELGSWALAEDSQLVSGSTTTMNLTLINPGVALTGVELNFSSDTPGFGFDESIDTVSISGQGSLVLSPITISTPVLPHGTPVQIDLEIVTDDEAWSWQKHFSVQAPLLQISGINLVAGELLAGELAQIELEFSNHGGVASESISLTALPAENLIISTVAIECPQVEMDGSATTSGAFTLALGDQLFAGEIITLRFECIQATTTDTLEYSFQLDGASRFAPSNADAYGYRMLDNHDLAYTKAPAYDWVELNPALGGSGTIIAMSDTYEEGDASRDIVLPFLVRYYGEAYYVVTICTNGWAAFGDQSMTNFHNRIIPSPIGPTAMLAPFWDDLLTNPGAVFYWYDLAQNRFIIEWSQMRNLGAQNNLSFQIIIYGTAQHPTVSNDNEIKFQFKHYENIDITANFSTTGIESPLSDMGIQASYNNIDHSSIGGIRNGTALLFTTERGERLSEAIAALSSTALSFTQNPWSSARDSIVITNAGEAPMAFELTPDSEFEFMPPLRQNLTGITKYTPDTPTNPAQVREGGDEYGYRWKDNTEEGGPVYEWIDIETSSNEVPYNPGDQDDCVVGPIDIGFNFPVYDDRYSTLYLGSNGTITFENYYSPYYNVHLPSWNAPGSLLAPWWDDLNNDDSPQGTFYFWTNEYDQCVITYKDFPKWGTSDFYTFQVILDSHGGILYQYERVDGVTTSATVGLQNSDRNLGMTIRYNESTPFEPGTAIKILPPIHWLEVSGLSGIIQPGESSSLVFDIEPRNSEPGNYESSFTLTTSAPGAPATEIVVSLDVILGETPYGDVNSDYLVNIVDLTNLLDFILLIEGMNDDQFEAANLSGDDAVNIVDAILLIEEILTNN